MNPLFFSTKVLLSKKYREKSKKEDEFKAAALVLACKKNSLL